MEKKAKAKSEMLKELSKEMSDDMYSPMKDMLKGKNLKKVTVASDSPEGLQKGLSMAEKLMKLKKDQNGEMEEESEDEMNQESEVADIKDDLSEMSEDEKLALFEMLKKELGKA